MFKEKFTYNPDLVRFEKVNKSFKDKTILFLLRFFFYGTIAAFLNIAFMFYNETPKEKKLNRNYEAAILKYELLNKKLNQTKHELTEIQQRDDQIYRSIFDLDPIPTNVREAGFGGINRYRDLENLKDADLVIETALKVDKFMKQVYVQSKSYDEIIKLVRNKDKMIASVPAIQPIAIKDFCRISSYYGRRIDPYTGRYKWHDGMDFTGPVGSDIYSTGCGKVVQAGYSRTGYGYQIIINHGFGYKTRYAHLSKILVNKGDKVERGQVIGLLGNSGRSTGPHLHYEVIKNNIALNPINFYFNDITAEQYDLMVKQASKEGGKTMD
jgi:murein DD-endopeptidase MepM/ murein hydrolase activator NlpD